MKVFLQYLKYEIHGLFHVHRRALAVLVCLPFIYTLLFGGMFAPNVVTKVPVGIVNLDAGPQGRQIIRELEGVPEIQVDFVADEEAVGQEALMQQRIRALVIILPTFSMDMSHYKGANVAVVTTNTNTLLGGTALKSIQAVLGTYNIQIQTEQARAAGLSRPMAPQIGLSLRSLYNSTGGYEDFFLAALMLHASQIAIVFTVGPMWFRDTFRRMEALREHSLAVIMAKALVYSALSTGVTIGCLWFSYLFFGLTIRANVGELFLLIALFSLAMTSFALFVGSGVGNIANAVTFPLFYIMPSVLFSGAIWPRYSMDPLSLGLSYIMPIGYSANTLRDMLLRGTAPSLTVDVFFLTGFTIVMLGGAWWLCRRRTGQRKGESAYALRHDAGM